MMKVSLIFLCLLVYTEQKSTPEDDSYVAAVLEYQVQADIDQNVFNYLQHIKDAVAQNADIVIFPEMTLTRGTRAIPVPIHGLLKTNPIPALYPNLYDEILVNISAAARESEVYVLVNVQEVLDCTTSRSDEECPEEKVYNFNTNVVFDRQGAVIDRYRKINLFGEFTRTPALKPELGIFETDFGVTFGHFICFDLMFQVPAIQIVDKNNLTDIIFSTMWFSELPYLTAVQIQEAYAYTMNVNFLASGANNVAVGSAGSGIFSGKAGALISTMPGLPTTRLLVSRVPKVPGQVNFPYPGPIYDNPEDHDSLLLKSDPSLPSHISRELVAGFQEFTLVDKDVSCKFTANLQLGSAQQSYKYRAAAFSGVRTYDGFASGGTNLCAVLACFGDSIDTCGGRFTAYQPSAVGQFEELTIEAKVPSPILNSTSNAHDSSYFPLAVKPSIMPLEPEDYTYSGVIEADRTVYTLKLNNSTAELYSFAVWGRVFGVDGQEPSPPVPGSAHRRHSFFLLLASVIVFLSFVY